MRIDDVARPDSPAARAALEHATAYQPPSLTAHALRSWLWAEGFARLEGRTDQDHELLFVAALLHDIGLVAEHDAHGISYEHAGGHVAVALTAGAGWAVARRRRVLDVIVGHNLPAVDADVDLEGHLLELATALDITGARADALPPAFVEEVLAAHPRGDLAEVFGSRVADQAARKPSTAARRILDGGLLEQLRSHPFESAGA